MVSKKGKVPSRSEIKDVDAFLKKVAMAPLESSSGRGRLIFALDATASREPTWDRACQIQGQMFTETAALGGLEIQMAYYRGFGEFKTTSWIHKSAELVRLMTAVYCLGGHTQLAKIFQHALAETERKKVNALVFIGDCVEEDVDHLCNLAGELGMRGVPAFVFQEGNEPRAARAFKQIAKLTNGAHCSFDSSSAKQLRDLLSAVAVYAAGGRKALENFSHTAGGEVRLLANQVR
jgi:hypothetical protein